MTAQMPSMITVSSHFFLNKYCTAIYLLRFLIPQSYPRAYHYYPQAGKKYLFDVYSIEMTKKSACGAGCFFDWLEL
jgi:hypothetical protein